MNLFAFALSGTETNTSALVDYPFWSLIAGAMLAFLVATLAGSLVGRTAFPLPAGDRRIGCIDGLRGYLAISVVVHHFIIWIQDARLGAGWSAPSVHLFNQMGAGAVALFFMATGFVFYPRIVAGFRTCSWPAVYLTRVFRIVPLVGVSVAIITVVIALRTGHALDRSFPAAAAKWLTAWSQPALLGYEDSGRVNAYVLWSLWYEWLFYVFVFPACALAMDLVRGRAPTWVVPVALLTGSLVARGVGFSLPMLTYLPLFALGMIAFECQRQAVLVRVLQTRYATVAAGTALAVGMTGFETPFYFALPLFGFFFICVACGNSLGGVLRTRASLVLGECSFGIYLLHGILLSVVFVDGHVVTDLLTTSQLAMLLPLVAGLAAILASFTFTTLERPAFRFGGQLAKLWVARGELRPYTWAGRPAVQACNQFALSLIGRALHANVRELKVAR